VVQEYHASDCDRFGNFSVHQRELWVHLGVPSTSLGALVTSLGAPQIRVEQSGKNIFFGNAAGAPGMLQVRLDCYRCACNAAGAPGMQQVRLEIIATTYRSTIGKTQVFRMYSHLCIYIATHLHTVYLHWLQAVVESNLRCT
jgi:hypothetical protein